MSYVPGDVIVNQIQVGGFDFRNVFISMDVYESIYTPGIIANITVLDTDDFLGRARLQGGERVLLTFGRPGTGNPASYQLLVNRISNISSTQSNHAKSYTIECVSDEITSSKSQYITKKYDNQQYSEMVSDLFGYLGNRRFLEIESTKGIQKYAVQNEKPFSAIDGLRRRSVSATNKSSTYLFFENRDSYHFVTLEKLLNERNVIKVLNQYASVGADMFNAPADNIIAYTARQQMNMGSVVGAGGSQGLYGVFNMFTLDYKETPVDSLSGLSGAGGKAAGMLGNYINSGTNNIGLKNIMAVANEIETGLGGKSGIPEAAPPQQAYAAAVASTAMSIMTIGDEVFTVGKSVQANIIKREDTTSGKTLEYGLSDVMLISNVRHQINPPGKRPRYVTILECVKGALEDS